MSISGCSSAILSRGPNDALFPSNPQATKNYAIFGSTRSKASRIESINTAATSTSNASPFTQISSKNHALSGSAGSSRDSNLESINIDATAISNSSRFHRNAGRNQVISSRSRTPSTDSTKSDETFASNSSSLYIYQSESESEDSYMTDTDPDEHDNTEIDYETVETVESKAETKSKIKTKRKSMQDFDFNKYIGIIKKWKPKSGVGNMVRCEVCFKYQDIVKMYGISRKKAQVTNEEGTKNRTNVLKAHLLTPYHNACMRKRALELERGSGSNIANVNGHTPLEKMVSTLNAEKSNTISRYIMAIYTDAKILTSSAFSWPARTFTSEYARKYNINDPHGNQEAMNQTNLQYINPVSYSEFLECIVEADRNVVAQKLEACLAMSLRVDGSIDRTNIDKIYMLAQIINAVGDSETLFLGIGERNKVIFIRYFRNASAIHVPFDFYLSRPDAE